LVRLNPDGRYDMHELLRQYAKEKLADQGTTERLRDAHCAYYLTFLGQHERDLKARRQLEAMNEVDPEFENIRGPGQSKISVMILSMLHWKA
jgi:predicted ATPase